MWNIHKSLTGSFAIKWHIYIYHTYNKNSPLCMTCGSTSTYSPKSMHFQETLTFTAKNCIIDRTFSMKPSPANDRSSTWICARFSLLRNRAAKYESVASRALLHTSMSWNTLWRRIWKQRWFPPLFLTTWVSKYNNLEITQNKEE
jgi:hypothetical protein